MSNAGEKTKRWQILPLLKTSNTYLSEKGIDSARLDAELLLASVLNLSRIHLYTNFEKHINQQELAKYRELIRQRAAGKPLAYILGEKEFFSLPFKVSPEVLIPRPETECLVEAALQELKKITENSKQEDSSQVVRALDLGTGSGCIAIALAHNLPDLKITATDISKDAIQIAEENAKTNKVEKQISFQTGDLYAAAEGEIFDLVISNPPYIAENDAEIMSEVKEYEPHQALFAGAKGLDCLQRLAAGLEPALSPKGTAFFEIGCSQKNKVKEIFQTAGFKYLEILPDLAGKPRIIQISRQAKKSVALTGTVVEKLVPESESEPDLDNSQLSAALDAYGSEEEFGNIEEKP